jgi:hypothetical protein
MSPGFVVMHDFIIIIFCKGFCVTKSMPSGGNKYKE